MDISWEDLKTVLHVVRAGRLTRASDGLGVNYTTIARRIARAEKQLGMLLFDRLSDGYQPNEAALMIARDAEIMEAQALGLARRLSGQNATLSGPLVITAPQLLIQWHLVHVIAAFCDAHPEVELRVNAAHDLLDLGRGQADLAVRISNNPGDDLTGLRLTAQQAASFASPEVASRIAAAPEAPVDWVLYSGAPGLPKGIAPGFGPGRIKARFDDMVAMTGAAQAGLGVLRMPLFLGRASPGLVQVPVLPAQPSTDIWTVAHPDLWQSAKVSAFRKILVGYFRENKAVFVA